MDKSIVDCQAAIGDPNATSTYYDVTLSNTRTVKAHCLKQQLALLGSERLIQDKMGCRHSSIIPLNYVQSRDIPPELMTEEARADIAAAKESEAKKKLEIRQKVLRELRQNTFGGKSYISVGGVVYIVALKKGHDSVVITRVNPGTDNIVESMEKASDLSFSRQENDMMSEILANYDQSTKEETRLELERQKLQEKRRMIKERFIRSRRVCRERIRKLEDRRRERISRLTDLASGNENQS